VIDPVEISYNSIDIVKRAKSVLTNKKTIALEHTWAKGQMLRYLIHVIGDVHQPLHDSNFYNETYPKGDLGGNKINIKV
jgi:S1/P1 Nuclease